MQAYLSVMVVAVLLGWPLGRYLAAVMRGGAMRSDALFGWIERPIYSLMGVDPHRGMGWKTYAMAFIASSSALTVLVWIVFMTQAWLPLNPDGVPNMRWDLALHTTISFLTNTNQQHYSGQAQLSYFAQITGILGLQVISPMMGIALVAATLRGFFGGRHGKKGTDSAAAASAAGDDRNSARSEPDLGNYWADLIRPTVRFMLPLCIVGSLLLTSQGVPSTLAGGPVATPVDASAGMTEQKLPLGPVASMVAAKQLGSNGGGWYGPNSAVPLENPTPISNYLETLAIVLIPVTLTFMVSGFTGRKKFTAFVFGSMLLMSVLSAGAAIWSEEYSPASTDIAQMEGKETRLGTENSALWGALTTQVNNGSVNMMHDSAAPLTGLVMMENMLVNSIWGGVGCGLQQFLVYLLLTIFLAGLMTGRTPELFGRKIEAPEVKLLSVLIVLQPLVILGFTVAALVIPGLAANSNPGSHGISQVLYEYISAYSNNGSGFEGLGDSTYWWNLSCVPVLLLGRYPGLIVPLVIAALLARKRVAPEGAGTLHIETPTFMLTLVGVVIILTVLQFTPALVLAPIGDHLSLPVALR